MLEPKGRLIGFDWKKELMRLGPPLQIRLNEEKVSSLIEVAGFKIDKIKEEGLHLYIIAATPKS
jgi:hypothetical protein